MTLFAHAPFRILIPSLILLAGAGLSGCAAVRSPLMGLWYTDVRSGLGATSNAAGNLTGEACATSILGVYADGDASIDAARRNGRINQISSIDEHHFSVLGVYGKYCVIVRGR